MNNKSLPTTDEIINSLKRSFIPTILIEGSDDVFIYRWLQSKFSADIIALQPCGGRINLFSIYDRRNEFKNKNVVFIADKDAYRFVEIPEDKNEIIFTTDYCIENDIYEGSEIHHFIDDEDKSKHDLLREIIGRWVAFEVQNFQNSYPEQNSIAIAAHINLVCPPELNSICPKFAHSIGYIDPEEAWLKKIVNEYNLNVRGKQLFQMLSRFMSKKGRFSNFSEKNLVEIALKQGNNVLLDRLVSDISNVLKVA